MNHCTPSFGRGAFKESEYMPRLITRLHHHRNIVWVVLTVLLIPILQNLGAAWLQTSFLGAFFSSSHWVC